MEIELCEKGLVVNWHFEYNGKHWCSNCGKETKPRSLYKETQEVFCECIQCRHTERQERALNRY